MLKKCWMIFWTHVVCYFPFYCLPKENENVRAHESLQWASVLFIVVSWKLCMFSSRLIDFASYIFAFFFFFFVSFCFFRFSVNFIFFLSCFSNSHENFKFVLLNISINRNKFVFRYFSIQIDSNWILLFSIKCAKYVIDVYVFSLLFFFFSFPRNFQVRKIRIVCFCVDNQWLQQNVIYWQKKNELNWNNQKLSENVFVLFEQ